MLNESSERRCVVRLRVPRHLTDPTLESRLVRLLDLSAEGARIEHAAPLNVGVICLVDFPRALGRFRLSGQVVWTRPRREELSEGRTRFSHESGLVFARRTPEQAKALAEALALLARATEGDSR